MAIKTPRFLKEYASYQKKDVKRYATNSAHYRAITVYIDRIVYLCSRGYITIDEAMRLLNSPLSGVKNYWETEKV